jgi:ABC-type antimicrobial peptide transport system permease subunit
MFQETAPYVWYQLTFQVNVPITIASPQELLTSHSGALTGLIHALETATFPQPALDVKVRSSIVVATTTLTHVLALMSQETAQDAWWRSTFPAAVQTTLAQTNLLSTSQCGALCTPIHVQDQ